MNKSARPTFNVACTQLEALNSGTVNLIGPCCTTMCHADLISIVKIVVNRVPRDVKLLVSVRGFCNGEVVAA